MSRVPLKNCNGVRDELDHSECDLDPADVADSRKPVVRGWDSIESNVDAFELQERHYDTVDAMASERMTNFDRLTDVAHFVSQARRDINALNRITTRYGLQHSTSPTAAVAYFAIKAVRGIVSGSGFPSLPTVPRLRARSERGQTPPLCNADVQGATPWPRHERAHCVLA